MDQKVVSKDSWYVWDLSWETGHASGDQEGSPMHKGQ